MSEETTIIDQAHAKMLDEMSKPHSEVLDYIHNWLCSQADEELLKGILTDGKTIQSAYNRLAKTAKTEKREVISPDLGFQIITDYFKGDETEIKMPGGVDTEDHRPKYVPPVVTPEELAERAEVQRKRNEENQAKQEQAKADVKLAAEKKRGVGMISIFDFIDDPVPAQDEVEDDEEEGDEDGLSEGDDE